MFYTVFKADPMNGKEGRRYRHTVLEKGGSKEEMEILEDFLGRKPSTESFYKASLPSTVGLFIRCLVTCLTQEKDLFYSPIMKQQADFILPRL